MKTIKMSKTIRWTLVIQCIFYSHVNSVLKKYFNIEKINAKFPIKGKYCEIFFKKEQHEDFIPNEIFVKFQNLRVTLCFTYKILTGMANDPFQCYKLKLKE